MSQSRVWGSEIDFLGQVGGRIYSLRLPTSSMFTFSENVTTFYRDIKKSDGTDLVIRLPQYWAERPVIARRHAMVDSNGVRKEPPLDYTMEIPVSDEFVTIMSHLNHSIMTMPGVSEWGIVVFPGTHTPGPAIILGSGSMTNTRFYHADGTIADRPYRGDMDGGSHVLMEIQLTGFLVTNGIVRLSMHIRRCVFVKADRNARIKLSFPGELCAVPAHFITMFNQLKPEDRTCPICMDVIDKNIAMTKCFHFFHCDCLQLCKSGQCPVCRTLL